MGEENIVVTKEVVTEEHFNPGKTDNEEVIMKVDKVQNEDIHGKKEKTLGWKIADVVGFLFVSAILFSLILLIITS